MDRRKFLGYFGCGCCGLLINQCSTVPITERKQLSIIPEATLNRQAEKIYEQIYVNFSLVWPKILAKQIDEMRFDKNVQGSNFFVRKHFLSGVGAFESWKVPLQNTPKNLKKDPNTKQKKKHISRNY